MYRMPATTTRYFTKNQTATFNNNNVSMSNKITEKKEKLKFELRKTGWYVSIKIVKFKTVEMDLVSLVIKDLTKHINFQIVSGNRERVKKYNINRP